MEVISHFLHKQQAIVVTLLIMLALVGALPITSVHADNVITTIAEGHSVRYNAVNPFTNMIYVTNTGYSSGPKGYVSVINGKTNTLIKQLQISDREDDIAVNPTTNKIYSTEDGIIFIISGKTDTVVGSISSAGGYGIAV